MNDPWNQCEYEYILALDENRLEDAKASLLLAIRLAKKVDAAPSVAGLAQKLGTVLWRQGDRRGALACYELSENLDPGSLLAKLHHAQFLCSEVGDRDAAIEKCNEIVAQATDSPFPETEGDFGSSEYIAAAQRVLDSMRLGG